MTKFLVVLWGDTLEDVSSLFVLLFVLNAIEDALQCKSFLLGVALVLQRLPWELFIFFLILLTTIIVGVDHISSMKLN